MTNLRAAARLGVGGDGFTESSNEGLRLNNSSLGNYADFSLHFLFDGVFNQRHGF
jgi:hypothetical protein